MFLHNIYFGDHVFYYLLCFLIGSVDSINGFGYIKACEYCIEL